MCEHKSTENASSQSRPCAKISTMSDNRSSIVNLSRRIALAPRTRRQSRPHGAHRGGLGQVNSAGRDVAEYNLERKHTSSTSSAGLPKRRAVDTYPCDALWLGPSWPCMSLDRYTQSTLNVARHAKKSEVEGEIESQIKSQEVQEGQASSAAQAAEGCCQHSGAGGCCNGSSRLRRQARSRRSGVCRSGAQLIPILATRYGWARPGHACLWTDILNPL